MALIVLQADGTLTLFNPEADDMLSSKEARKVQTLPHSMLLYATHLTRLHLEAGREIVSLRAHSCFSLNSRAPSPLFGPPSFNLLEVLGSYERPPPWSQSAVGRWVTPMPPAELGAEEQPACSTHLPKFSHLYRLAANHSITR